MPKQTKESKKPPHNRSEEGKDASKQAAEDIKLLKIEIEELKDKNLRIFAEFDNHRKRTAKERIELIKNAASDIVTSLLSTLKMPPPWPSYLRAAAGHPTCNPQVRGDLSTEIGIGFQNKALLFHWSTRLPISQIFYVECIPPSEGLKCT